MVTKNIQAQKLKIGIGVVLTDGDGKILLGKRQNILGDGMWGLPGGHQKLGESIFECAKREVMAEVNIDLKSMHLLTVAEMVETGMDYQLVELGYFSTDWQGILELKEHKYCSEWKFFEPYALPPDIFAPHLPIVEKAQHQILQGQDEPTLLSIVHPHFKIYVGSFVINKKGQLLMGLRRDEMDKGNWAVPGGHLDVGDTLEECALRELQEETGLVADDAIQFSQVEQPMTLSNKHYLHFGFIIKDFEEKPVINGEPEDIERWEWFDIQELPPNIAPSQREMILKFLKLNKVVFKKN